MDMPWNLYDEAYRSARGLPYKPRVETGEEPSLNPETGGWRFPPFRGMKVPFEIRYDPEVGRTMHALTNLSKYRVVWDVGYTVAFPPDNVTTTPPSEAFVSNITLNATSTTVVPQWTSYRKFLEHIHSEYVCRKKEKESTLLNFMIKNKKNKDDETTQSAAAAAAEASTHDWTCDALMWTYQSGYTDSLLISFDHGSMFNDARGDADAENLQALQCNGTLAHLVTDKGSKVPNGDTTDYCMQFYSTRNVLAGEELRYDYGYFAPNETVGDEEYYDDLYNEEEDEEEDEDEYIYIDDDDDYFGDFEDENDG